MTQLNNIVRENLPWPGARATAQLITTLHGGDKTEHQIVTTAQAPDSPANKNDDEIWKRKAATLFRSALLSGVLAIIMHFAPVLRRVPVFGHTAAAKWLWSVDLAPGFFGQGIITGPVIPLHMLAGAVVGWGILSPYAKHQGWAPGEVDDWATGSRGWIIWVSLAALLADASIKLSWAIVRPVWQEFIPKAGMSHRLTPSERNPLRHHATSTAGEQGYMQVPSDEPDVEPELPIRVSDRGSMSEYLLQPFTTPKGLLLLFLGSVVMCTVVVRIQFGQIIPWYFTVLAIALSLPMAVVGIRSLAETDYNPESALVSQLVFAALISASNPSAITINLISAALAQAGANQAGAISYDFKVGHLVGAPLEVQIPGQIVGSIFGALTSCGIYKLYSTHYPIPGPILRVPSAFVVLSTARLLMGRGLPEGVAPFVIAAAVFSAVATILKMRFSDRWWQALIPSGVSFAVGIYNTPSFTLTRAIGGLASHYYQKKNEGEGSLVVLASGLILGESIASLATLVLPTTSGA